MKRASYREAVAWIAGYDGAADDNALDPEAVSEMVTTCLIADLFDKHSFDVAHDVVRYRVKKGWGK